MGGFNLDFLSNKKKGKTSTNAMREAAALLRQLGIYQTAFLQEKLIETERLIAQQGGNSADIDDGDNSEQAASAEDDADWEDFFND